MKNLILSLGATGLMAGAAFADLATLDADASGSLSLVELQASFAALTEEGFTAIDTNADGSIDATELAAAEEAGLLKTE